MALIVQPTEIEIEKASNYLKQGNLVAFPTETVYGLGADALNEEAVKKIFQYKDRPLNDPVIVHVEKYSQVQDLINLTEKESKFYKHLTQNFWPGPLTIVAKATSKVPDIITAKSGFVGIRSPSHKVAHDLLKVSQLPIAAPSANRFGHVSPTTAQHVFEDLGKYPITILDGGSTVVGIESTVMKLQEINGKIQLTFLRKGAISPENIKESIKNIPEFNDIVEINVVQRVVDLKKKEEEQKAKENENENENQNENQNENENEVSPGLHITHYAPDKETYLILNIDLKQDLKTDSNINPNINLKNYSNINSNYEKKFTFSETVLIDFKSQFLDIKDKFFAYSDLSPNGDVEESSVNLYSLLRWSETFPQTKVVILPEITQFFKNLTKNQKIPSILDALADRMFRASSGKTAFLDLHNYFVCVFSKLENLKEN
ncbi:hypothetical protein M0811_09173 [Anaeramoeba ignava]|uniref:Threonylcarbamoyl-AMP synthase n=1 Tax=Anaeramoeba ignava TaxID=1746090 RepID=A0A9Q0RBQ5_ANAIG|nr:hypothetical protein M0811_09173 [Anaeramoeba ignava]